MNQDQKFITQYLKTIVELSNETGMSKKKLRQFWILAYQTKTQN